MVTRRGSPRTGLVAAIGFILAAAQARGDGGLPPDVAAALRRNAEAMSPLSATWEKKYSTPLSKAEFRQWVKLDDYDSFFEPAVTEYARQGEMYYALVTYHRTQHGKRTGRQSEKAFDGEVFYSGSGTKYFSPPVVRIRPLEKFRKDLPDLQLWTRDDYFAAAGFQLPATPGTLLDKPQSLVLALLQKGARVTAVRREALGAEGEHVVVELADGQRTHRFHLDPAKGYAVRRLEERGKGGGRVRLVENREFTRLGGSPVWLPKRSHAAWHTWSTTDRVRSTPLVVVECELKSVSQAPVPRDRFVLNYDVPGAYLSDARLPEAQGTSDGMVHYRVPADPADLDKVIEWAVDGQTVRRPWGVGRWAAVVGGNVAAAAVVVLLVRRWLARTPAAPQAGGAS